MHYMRYRDLYCGPDKVVDQFSNAKPFHPAGKVRGEFKMVLRDKNGRYLRETPWMPNMLLDNGINDIIYNSPSTGSDWGWFHIGTGVTPVAATDTTVEGRIGMASSQVSGSVAVEGATALNNWTCYYQEAKRIYDGDGLITQIGINGSSTNSDMTVKTLVAVPLAKTIDQVVDVYHRMYFQFDVTINTGVVNIAGDDYNYRSGMYRLEFTEGSTARLAATKNFPSYDNFFYANAQLRTDDDFYQWGAVEDLSGGTGSYTSEDGGRSDNETYDTSTVAGSGYATSTAECPIGLTEGNIVGSPALGGIKVCFFQCCGAEVNKPGHFVQLNKISDGTGLYKDDTQTLLFNFGCSYGRDGSLLP